jgi:iron complex outermembrane receptor protein
VKSFLLVLAAALCAFGGEIRGTVTLQSNQQPLHHISVLLLPQGRVIESDNKGQYSFAALPAGRYTVLATGEGLSDTRKIVDLKDGATETIDFQMGVSPLRQELTVTASANRPETFLETFSPTLTLDSAALASKAATSLGDVLDGEAGIHRRSFGPGSTRPVIRGFDGDRVLILQDGVRTGTLGAQSGDHGEPVDPQGLDRVEVLRGPGTLLYGSSAMGGVVNMISGHHEAKDQGHRGLHGSLSGIAGTNNGLHGGNASLDYGWNRWVWRVSSGGQRTSDYRSPIERIFNSRSRSYTGSTGLSYYGKKNWFTGSFSSQRGLYQLPYKEEEDHHDDHDKDHDDGHHDEEEGHAHENVSLPNQRWNFRLNGGQRDRYQYSLNYSDWKHQEVADGEVETRFFNKQLDYRFLVEQPRRGPLSGSFGVWGLRRDYESRGLEAITPPTVQNAFAGYAVETIHLEKFRIQLGGRLETNRYRPRTGLSRDFTGFSGGAGLSYSLDSSSVLVANYSLAYRAPAIEELYANGPHPGLLAFEIGDSRLNRERMNGLDFSYRRQDRRIRTEANFFHYWLSDQVFLSPTGKIDDGLPVANYRQADTRYYGFDTRLTAGLTSWAWLNAGFDLVRAEIRASSLSLPRTPPVRTRLGMDFRYRNFSLAPEAILTARQSRVFTNETPTDGYLTANLRGGYSLVRQHTIHFFGVNWFNANNRLFRNHLSFIKDFAPEIGRGLAVTYSLRFF